MAASPRIVSLVPSLTELLFDLGLGPYVVGRTGFCIHPREAVRAVPKVGGTKDVDVAKVRALAPTHVVVNVDENERATVDALREFVGDVIVTHPLVVDDNLALYRTFGERFGCAARAAALAARLEEELATTRALAFEPLRVLYLIWKKPWMTVSSGTYVSAALREIGLVTVAPASPLRYPALEFGSFGPEHWDAVLLASEPYRFTEAHARALRADPALRGRPVALIDGEMTSWYGSRAVAALGDLREYRRRFEQTAGLAPRPGTPLASCAGAAS